MAGCGGMWQGVGACGRCGGRVWGMLQGSGYMVGGQAYGMDGDVWLG